MAIGYCNVTAPYALQPTWQLFWKTVYSAKQYVFASIVACGSGTFYQVYSLTIVKAKIVFSFVHSNFLGMSWLLATVFGSLLNF